MRQEMSLEEERQLLLQQLESSRAVYRRMLTDTEDVPHDSAPPYMQDDSAPDSRAGFPKSHTMRLLMRHPYLAGLGALALIMLGKNGWAKVRRKAEPVPSRAAEDNDARVKKSIAATTLGTSLATTAAMMLRNPAQVQAAMRAIGVAMNYYKSRRRNAQNRF